jgi:hypothetical protein
MIRFVALAWVFGAFIACPLVAQEQDPMLSQRVVMIFCNMAKDDQLAEGIEPMCASLCNAGRTLHITPPPLAATMPGIPA